MHIKAKDNFGEPFKTISFIWNKKQLIMLAFANEYWYDGNKENKLQFTYKNRAIYLRKLAIKLPNIKK